MWTALLASAAAAGPNLVFLSLDTTRVDALSCYGTPPGPYRTETRTTPNIDALAHEGVRFDRFFAHAPSTLSSHASMFTGLDPHGHGVVRNGFPVDPTLPTLAERLGTAGWDTVAVLGASVLEQAMGLDRGFRVWDDTMTTRAGTVYQASADDVVRRALHAVDARPDPDAPLFLFAHFYDPHAPYMPPEPWATRFSDPGAPRSVPLEGPGFRAFVEQIRRGTASPHDVSWVSNRYLAEVAFVDDQVGVLLSALRTRGLLDHALVVVVADHGETLGDDPIYAWSHGSNVADEVVHVPLVVRGYGMAVAERTVVRSQAGMSGLAPTIERLLGLPPTLGAHDFADLLRAGPFRDEDGWPERPTTPVFFEATRPRQAEDPNGWNNARMFRGVRVGEHAVEAAPFVRLPWRFTDGGTDPELLALLAGLVADWDRAAPAHAEASTAPTTRTALEVLGYVE